MLQYKRGTSAQCATFIPLPGQPLWNLETDVLTIGDGVTPGGRSLIDEDAWILLEQIANKVNTIQGNEQSTTKYASAKAVADAIQTSLANVLTLKGFLDGRTTPNYPAASPGFAWVVSHDGLIGGPQGRKVFVGDAVIAISQSAGGLQQNVGLLYIVLSNNIENRISERLAEFEGTQNIYNVDSDFAISRYEKGGIFNITATSPVSVTISFDNRPAAGDWFEIRQATEGGYGVLDFVGVTINWSGFTGPTSTGGIGKTILVRFITETQCDVLGDFI